MSTIFNIRNLKLPGGISRASVIIGTVVVVLAIVGGSSAGTCTRT
jgi:phospholipid/cholesterol/gamma-HCH transport system substrate-binding protein